MPRGGEGRAAECEGRGGIHLLAERLGDLSRTPLRYYKVLEEDFFNFLKTQHMT